MVDEGLDEVDVSTGVEEDEALVVAAEDAEVGVLELDPVGV